LARLVLVLISQPSFAWLLQLAKPRLQLWIPHEPLEQRGVALAVVHWVPQPPQFARSLPPVFTSQPSLTVPLQLVQPGSQLEIAQLPVLQAGVACGVVQVRLHAPQLFRSFETFTSQPSVGELLQLAKFGLHEATPHAPATQLGVPLLAAQLRLHAPQLLRSVLVLISQPSFTWLLQLAKPRLQLWIPQLPITHRGVALLVAQMVPQPPQF
jgi:hypothetical protein